MNIVIESIDSDSFALRGYTPAPSYKVRFNSEVFEGVARLVPACEVEDISPGATFFVAFAQESLSALKLSEPSAPIGA